MAQPAALKRLLASIASTLRISRRAAAEIAGRPDNASRLRHCVDRFEDCVVVPKDDGLLVVFTPCGDELRMSAVLQSGPGDLVRWRALTAADRAEPAGLPVH